MHNRPLRALVGLAASVSVLILASAAPAVGQPAAPPSVLWVDQFGDGFEGVSTVAVAGSDVYFAGVPASGGSPVHVRRYTDAGELKWFLDLSAATLHTPALAADATQVCVGGTMLVSWQSAGFVSCWDPERSPRGDAYVETEAELLGPAPSTRVTGIALAEDALYVVGVTEGVLKGGCLDGPCAASQFQDGFIRKYSTLGGVLTPAWTRQVDLGGYFQGFFGGALSATGNVLVWGDVQVPGQGHHGILRCYEPDGDECGSSILPLDNASPFSGTFGPDVFYMLALGTGGAWVHRYSLPAELPEELEPGKTVLLDPATFSYSLASEPGGVLVAAGLVTGGSYGGYDAFLARYDDELELSWSLTFGSDNNDSAIGVAADPNHVYVSGQTQGAVEEGTTVTNVADAFIARVARPEEPGIPDLIAEIEDLLNDGILKRGQANSLIVKLEHALEALAAGDTARAVRMLEAFIHEVAAFEKARILTPEKAGELIGIARAVIAEISE